MYQAAVTVLMRVVFLLYAEERGLLRVDDDTYADAYAISTLAGSCANALPTRRGRPRAVHHRLAPAARPFRAVHRGARHEQLILPGYGGSLFDPDRFPWLEGRAGRRPPASTTATPCASTTARCSSALEALQRLRFASERRQVSFRASTSSRSATSTRGCSTRTPSPPTTGSWVSPSDSKGEKDGPEVPLTDLSSTSTRGPSTRHLAVGQIKDRNGNRSPAAILKALTAPTGAAADTAWTGVLEACGGDEATARRSCRSRGCCVAIRATCPSFIRRAASTSPIAARAHTGAVYTPAPWPKQVVARTLEPIVKSPGPLDTEDEAAWVNPDSGADPRSQGLRHRRRQRRIPGRLPPGTSPTGSSTPNAPMSPPKWASRLTMSRPSSTPAARSSITASTGSTSTRWPWRWRNSHSGWSRSTKTARSGSLTTGSRSETVSSG